MPDWRANLFGFPRSRSPCPEVLGLLSLEGLVSERMAIETLTLLRSLPGNPPIRGLILRISSGGGSLGAAQAISEGLQFVSSELGIPTVSSVIDLALSAGFYVALSADRFVATNAASLGGVGGIIRTFSLEPLLHKIGVEYEAIASGSLKDALFFASSLTDGQRDSLQSVVDDCSQQFLTHIRARRAAYDDRAPLVLGDGRIITGERARSAGLIDDVGGLFSAITACAEMAGLEAPSLRVLGGDRNSIRPGHQFSSLLGALRRLYPT